MVCGIESSGNKKEEIWRQRKDLERDICAAYGDYFFRRVYRMTKESFNELRDILKPRLEAIFFPGRGGSRNPATSNYLICTKMRLSMALRYFAGGSPYDIMLTHGVSYKSVFISVWGVVDAVNSEGKMAFHFPDHDAQTEIAQGFMNMSGASFPNVIEAIDGIRIWTLKLSRGWCEEIKCGEGQFKCTRKDKFGLNMQAMCDDKMYFTWIDI